MEKERSLDKLITISKVFMDARVAELRRENEDLRLQLFWKDYDVHSLLDVVTNSNNWEKSPQCNCLTCAVSGRTDGEEEIDSDRKCAFIPWLEEKITECGLTFGNTTMGSSNHSHLCNTLNGVWDVDCHLVKLGRSDWRAFSYGKRLYQAQTADDAELKKLKILFEQLDAETLHEM
jgi:hypothetical protein